MGDLAQLITALAALVTSIGGATAAVIVAIRSGNRQAQVAAKRSSDIAAGEHPGRLAALGHLDADEASAVFDLLKNIPGAMPDTDGPGGKDD